jgi:hypothetical protein
MLLYHATTRQALSSIQTEGLCLRYAALDKRIQGVWLHTSSKRTWALLHTQKRHHASLEDLVVITVNVPRSWLKRFQKGVWYSIIDISPKRIVSITDGIDYAGSAK